MYEKELGIPKKHRLVQTKTDWKAKKGQDTDIYWYDEFNTEGVIIAKYIVRDSTSIYPPFKRTITFEKEII